MNSATATPPAQTPPVVENGGTSGDDYEYEGYTSNILNSVPVV